MSDPITYKCVICGAELESIGHGMGKCPSCGFKQSMPTISSQKLERANKFRRDEHDFKKALKLYEEVSEETPDEAEAFWGAAICKYGVEFVNDNNDSIAPTFYQTNKFRFSGMSEFKAACEKADDEQKSFYENTASKIDETHRKIIEIFAAKKFSSDIYVRCCTDENNIASEELRNDAKKIISKLRDKDYSVYSPDNETFDYAPGSPQYESYAYNGLAQAKVMIILGNDPEQFTNKWLKNEWTRFNVLHKENKQCIIIPVIFDIDPYKLPMELQSTQAIDWHSAEAMDLVMEAVDKATGRYVKKSTREKIEKINNIINERDKEKTGQLYANALRNLNNNNIDSAKSYLGQLLNIDPSYHKAYWLRLCIEMNTTPDVIQNLRLDFGNNPNYISAVHHADDESREKYEQTKNQCLKNLTLQQNYNNEIRSLMNSCCQMQNSQIIDIGKKNTLEQSINEALNADIYTALEYEDSSTLFRYIFIFVLKIVLLIAGYSIGSYMNTHVISVLSSAKQAFIAIFYLVITLGYYALLFVNIRTHQFFTGSKAIGIITGAGQFVLSFACTVKFNGIIQHIGPWLAMTTRYNSVEQKEVFVSFWNFVIFDILAAVVFLIKFTHINSEEKAKKKKRKVCEQNFKEYCSLLDKSRENLANAKKAVFEKYNLLKDTPECVLQPVTDNSYDIVCDKLIHSYDDKFVIQCYAVEIKDFL